MRVSYEAKIGRSLAGLVAEGLVVERGGRAVVAGIDIDIPPGTITALLGANGAGKSSLVLALAGALPIARGRFCCDGRLLGKMRADAVRRFGIAAIPEGHRVLGQLTVEDNLRIAGMHLSSRELQAAVAAAFETFPELRERKDTLAGALSGGQHQMVVIAQAIVSKPRYILADELSFGLAPVIVARLVPVIVDLARQGIGVLLIEQFTEIALQISQKVFVMERGQIAFCGPPSELKKNPQILHKAYLA